MKTAGQDNPFVNRFSGHQREKLSGGLLSLLLLIFISLIHFYFPLFDRQADLLLSIMLAERGYRFFDRITELGNIWLVLPAAFVLLILFLKSHRENSFHLLVTVFGGAFFGFFLKILLSPDLNAFNMSFQTGRDLGFPSGHALMAALFYGWLTFTAATEIPNRYLRWSSVFLGIVIIILIGASRLVISVHLATDVLGGWAAGVFWLCISFSIVAWYKKALHLLSPGGTFDRPTGE
ncbi:MAG: phosphatase PAP2 family protein [Anaerolineaceae bacterium]